MAFALTIVFLIIFCYIYYLNDKINVLKNKINLCDKRISNLVNIEYEILSVINCAVNNCDRILTLMEFYKKELDIYLKEGIHSTFTNYSPSSTLGSDVKVVMSGDYVNDGGMAKKFIDELNADINNKKKVRKPCNLQKSRNTKNNKRKRKLPVEVVPGRFTFKR